MRLPILFVSLFVALAAGFAALAAGQAPVAAKAAKTAQANPSLVARGKYIVDGVARCTQCHTPEDSRGQKIEDEYLMGGPVQMQATYANPDWAIRVPRISGGPAGTDEDVIRELTTGIARTGRPLRPPMPQFRMSREDAEAVLAYLKSLKR